MGGRGEKLAKMIAENFLTLLTVERNFNNLQSKCTQNYTLN